MCLIKKVEMGGALYRTRRREIEVPKSHVGILGWMDGYVQDRKNGSSSLLCDVNCGARYPVAELRIEFNILILYRVEKTESRIIGY
jgi:hypothetical protein